MKKIFLLLFILSFASYNCVWASTSNIANLVFTTPIRTVDPNTVSDAIIVQTENSSGASEVVDETNDVTFTTSSPSGQFLNSSGNAVTTTMSKYTSSRTFYYKDTSSGQFLITVTIKGRTSGITFSSSQQINVGVISDNTNTTSTTTSTTSSTTSTTSESTVTTSNSSQSVSSHSGENDISNFKAKLAFGVDAGRERIVSVNAPINFDAEVGDFSNNLYARVACDWSFGDGTMVGGKSVSHTYSFPGEYNVLLNVTIGDTHMTDRTRVKVIEPSLSIVSIKKGQGGFVEIKNNSSDELNLQSFKVLSGDESFIFAPDTIIDSGASIKFPIIFSYSNNNPVSIIYPDGPVATTYSPRIESIPVSYIPEVAVEKQEYKAPVKLEREINTSIHDATTSEDIMDRVDRDDGITASVFKFFGNFFGK